MKRLLAVLAITAVAAASGALSACATPPAEPGAGEVFYNPMARAGQDQSLDVVSELAGAWSNAAQYAAAPDDLKRTPVAGHP